MLLIIFLLFKDAIIDFKGVSRVSKVILQKKNFSSKIKILHFIFLGL